MAFAPLLTTSATMPAVTTATVETVTELPPDVSAWITVVVPTRNERHGIGDLLSRIAAGVGSVPVEVLFVDDSDDDTPDAVRHAAGLSGLAVRLLHRPRAERRGGLGTAVAAGLRAARGPWAVVMDADLQHPPELITRLVAVGQTRQLDLVAASRRVGSGSSAGLADGYRKGVSGLANHVARWLFPRRLAHLSDPMSGFFAVRTAAVDLDALDPTGFKILLEVAVRQPGLATAEVPFVFGTRLADASKASAREGARFLHHLMRLRFDVLRGQVRRRRVEGGSTARLVRMIAFALVGVSGLAVNSAVLWMLAGSGHHYLWAAVAATEASTTWNFVLTEALVFRGRKPGTRLGRGVRFYLLNHVALLLRLPVIALLVEGFGAGVLTANLVSLALMFLVRFLVADAAIYAPSRRLDAVMARRPMRVVVDTGADAPAPAPARRHAAVAARPGQNYLPYRYAIDGVITVGSQVPLRELEYFRAQWLGNDVDLAIRVGHVGTGTPRARAMMTQTPSGLQYQEHLGRLGANFRVELGTPIEVTCSPALAGSPHVLYTNVIEALLRFVAVSRGVILLHSACLELNGSGLLLSARTDTGKTGTVLKLLREHGAKFLSDDMTVLDRNGVATCFPKPLTISHHTLRAVQAGDLTPAEWRRLKLQSRLHSKEGRNFGMVLAGMNIPIMGLNSLTQRIVPPPKYAVDRLVECRVIRQTTINDLFIIERGAPELADVPADEILPTLVANTDDAYGFPPFREMAPSIVIGGNDYLELRRQEEDILREAVSRIRVRRIATDDFTWADRISDLLSSGATTPADIRPVATATAPLTAAG